MKRLLHLVADVQVDKHGDHYLLCCYFIRHEVKYIPGFGTMIINSCRTCSDFIGKYTAYTILNHTPELVRMPAHVQIT